MMKMNRQINLRVKVIFVLGLISHVFATPTTITAPPVSENLIDHGKDDLKSIFGQCLHKKNVSKCLKERVIDIIDEIIESDNPLSVNVFNLKMSLNRDPQFKVNPSESDTSRSFDDIISQKLKSLLESRVIQVKLSDEEDDSPTDHNEARKKKDGGGKHGHMMMSGMALMAFFGQLFMSKVAFMSGAALILAKIALLFSALSSLKKSGGTGGSEHVVYAADVGKQGWQRSIHAMSPVLAQQHQQVSEDLAYRGHSTLPTYDGV